MNGIELEAKETLIQIFERLSAVRQVELLEFALFMQNREAEQPLASNELLETFIAQLQTQSAPQSPKSLAGSVLQYDAPFDPVALADWDTLK